MERAGAGVARALERLAPDGPVTVVCGKGNNGGDGLVAARLLRESGRPVAVVCVAPPAELTGDARANLERLPGAPPVRLDGTAWQGQGDGEQTMKDAADLFGSHASVIDALLGTGFDGEPRGAVAEAIVAINAAGAPVVSVDVPSGVDASTGVVRGGAVCASLTVTFHAAKPGLWINPGKAHAGEVQVLDIGIPRGAPDGASIGLIDPSVLEQLPRRDARATKFTSGHVLVVGGSRGLTGAPQMAAKASMRAGAGYVTACVPASLQELIAGAGTPEMMTRGLPDDDGALTAQAVRRRARGEWPWRRAGAGSGARAQRRRVRVRTRARRRSDGRDGARRRRPERACRSARRPASEDRADGADAPRRRARAAARARQRGDRARTSAPRHRRCAAGTDGGLAEGRRHADRRAGRHRGGEPRRQPGARHSWAPATSSRASSRRCWPRVWKRSRPPRPGCGCTRRPAERQRAGWARPRA